MSDLLRTVSSEMNTAKGQDSLLTPGEEQCHSDVKIWVPTGFPMLDLALGGGIPMGRMVEVTGDPGHGKSTLLTSIMAQCQLLGGMSILLDRESKWDRARAIRMGHQESSHLSMLIRCLEDGFAAIQDTVEKLRGKPPLYRKWVKEMQGKPDKYSKELRAAYPKIDTWERAMLDDVSEQLLGQERQQDRKKSKDERDTQKLADTEHAHLSDANLPHPKSDCAAGHLHQEKCTSGQPCGSARSCR